MQLCDLLDQRSPLSHCRATRPFAVRLSRRGKRLLHLFVGRGRVLLHYVPGRGVDHCVLTHVTPLISEIRCVYCNGIATLSCTCSVGRNRTACNGSTSELYVSRNTCRHRRAALQFRRM